MLLYRVAPYLASAKPKDPGHPEYLPSPLGEGRIDNRGLYHVWYLSVTEAGAIGEVFEGHPIWNDKMFKYKGISGARFALHTFSVPDACRIVDLDDAQRLLDYGLRPTQVVSRNKSVTQIWARKLYNDVIMTGPAWEGVRWWSRLNPDWPVIGLFRVTPTYVRTSALEPAHPAVQDAAQTLRRRIK